jgi:hypothetical protein
VNARAAFWEDWREWVLCLGLQAREKVEDGSHLGYAETLEARRLLASSCVALESGGWRRALLVRLDDRGDELGNDSELDVLLNSQFARLG